MRACRSGREIYVLAGVPKHVPDLKIQPRLGGLGWESKPCPLVLCYGVNEARFCESRRFAKLVFLFAYGGRSLLVPFCAAVDLVTALDLKVRNNVPCSQMDLKQKLDKFKNQQEKCQSTLTKVAASRPPPAKNTVPKKPPVTASSSAQQKPLVPQKFSNNTEKLQHINTIRKSAVGAQIKRVIDLLLETRQAFTPEEINEACYVDVNANKGVFESLKKNVKVTYDGQRFSYKSKHDVKDKNELLVLIRKAPEGIAVVDLKDAYPTVLDDLQELKASGEVWLLSNFDSQEDIVYPNDPKINIKVDDDVKQLFRDIELPKDMVDIEKDLQKNGMKPATNTAKRKAAAQVQGVQSKPKAKKKREFNKRTRLTNAHLPELFK